MTPIDPWKTVFERFDPELPVQQRAWRAAREHSPAGRIEAWLGSSFGPPRVLLLGTIGTGKSTELLRIAEARAATDFVVHLDLVRHFGDVVGDLDALRQISSWEVCFLAGLALMRAATEQLGHTWSQDDVSSLERAWKALAKATGAQGEPSIDVGKLVQTLILGASIVNPAAAAGLGLLQAAAGAVGWNIPLGVGARQMRDQASEMQDLLGAVNQLIRRIRADYRRVVLVLDGLDRIQDFESAEKLFVRSELIGRLDCPLVVAGPFVLMHHRATATIRHFDIHTLENEPVLDHGDPTRPGAGVAFFEQVFQLRVKDFEGEGMIPAPLLARLAYYSGGRGRDFVKTVRMLAFEASPGGTAVATEPQVARVIDDARRLVEIGVDRRDLDILRGVMEDPQHLLPSDDRVAELLLYRRLLPYPNESGWYYPHPLLTLNLLKRP